MNVHLLTFGSGEGWRNARQRTGAAAKACGFRALVCDETCLGLWPHHGWAQTPAGARGYGYWGWKPYLAGRHVTQLLAWPTSYGLPGAVGDDFLVYSDAGNLLAPSDGWARYLDVAREHGGCFFAHPPSTRDSRYTKADLLDHFDHGTYSRAGMIWAGAWILRVDEKALTLLRHWSAWYDSADHHYVDDSPSRRPNTPDFVEHRHDQSVFSLLVKSRYSPACWLSEQDECSRAGSPIHAARVR